MTLNFFYIVYSCTVECGKALLVSCHPHSAKVPCHPVKHYGGHAYGHESHGHAHGHAAHY